MFSQERIAQIKEFYATRDRWKAILEYRKLCPLNYPVKNLFYGDSITEAWPLHEFFPNHNILNRGIGGDNVHGLYYRLEDDVFAYKPKRVFLMAGINGIEDEDLTDRLKELATLIRQRGSEVFCCSILPLRFPDNWNRFQYQDKIVAVNRELASWATAGNADGFIDYHSVVKDVQGQLAAEYANVDGTHVKFAGYCRMAKVVEPYLV